MQYKVPQNVDIEDKVIAGLTLRQFMFLLIAGSIILIMKYTLPPAISFLFIPLSLITAGMGISLAFVKINDRPLEIFLMSAAKTVMTPPKRVWQKEIYVEEVRKSAPQKKVEYQKKQNVSEIKGNLQRLATLVDSGGAHGIEAEKRSTNIQSPGENPTLKVDDILGNAEKPSEKISTMIGRFSKTSSPSAEVPISALATKDPEEDKKKINYEGIQLTNETELTEILEDVKKDEREKEEKLASAKIKKFSDKG